MKQYKQHNKLPLKGDDMTQRSRDMLAKMIVTSIDYTVNKITSTFGEAAFEDAIIEIEDATSLRSINDVIGNMVIPPLLKTHTNGFKKQLIADLADIQRDIYINVSREDPGIMFDTIKQDHKYG